MPASSPKTSKGGAPLLEARASSIDTMAAASQLSSSVRVSPTRVALRSTAVKRVAAKAPVRGLVRAEAAPEFAGLGPEM